MCVSCEDDSFPRVCVCVIRGGTTDYSTSQNGCLNLSNTTVLCLVGNRVGCAYGVRFKP